MSFPVLFFYFFKFIYLFIYFGCIGSSLLRAGFLQLRQAGATFPCDAQASHCGGFSLQSTGSRLTGFSSCGMPAQQLWLAGSRAQAQQLWHTDLAAPRYVGSSRTRAQTHVPCIGRWILNHCATSEVPFSVLFEELWCIEQCLIFSKEVLLLFSSLKFRSINVVLSPLSSVISFFLNHSFKPLHYSQYVR